MTRELIIDAEFQALIPALDPAEFEQLEKSLRGLGCMDPIKVWQGHDIIIDGHNRYGICQRFNIPFEVTEIMLTDRDTVKNFMILNQLGRRNLSKDDMTILLGKLYNARKKEQGAPAGNANAKKQMDQNDPVVSTAEAVAKETGHSPATVKRAGKIAKQAEDMGLDTEILAGKATVKDVKAKLKPELILEPDPEEYDTEKPFLRIVNSIQRAFDKVPVTHVGEVRDAVRTWLNQQ